MPNPFGSAMAQAVTGPPPFYRKAWDDPRRYKLNRAYGDEFEETSFTDLTRKWKSVASSNGIVAADFDFTGGSSVGWRPSNAGAGGNAFAITPPAGDFEALLEFAYCGTGANPGGSFVPCIALTDSAGTGAAGAIYGNDGKGYDTVLTAWATGTSHNTGVVNTLDGRHLWLAVRRTGTTLQTRTSNDGSTFTSLTTGATVSATAPFLSIAKCYPGAGWTPQFLTLYRFNVYPGPTFFPG